MYKWINVEPGCLQSDSRIRVSFPGHLHWENLFHELFWNSSVILKPFILFIYFQLLSESVQSKVTVLICMFTVCTPLAGGPHELKVSRCCAHLCLPSEVRSPSMRRCWAGWCGRVIASVLPKKIGTILFCHCLLLLNMAHRPPETRHGWQFISFMVPEKNLL